MAFEKIFEHLQIQHWGILEIGDEVKELLVSRERFIESIMKKSPRNEFEYPVDERFLFLNQRSEPVSAIVAIALPYDCVGKASPNTPGIVDSSAWGFDYHQVVGDKLRAVNAEIEDLLDGRKLTPEICVDTSRYIDREIGLYTGLGKLGLNHFLIHPDLGTQFFIGYLIYREPLNLGRSNFDLSQTLYEPCESCNRCVVACPAQICGLPDMDSGKCISSLTQTKRKLSDHERVLIGNRLYGCNICQKVCPSNMKTEPCSEFQVDHENAVDPKEILLMSNKRFKREFAQMGFSWRPAWVYKRNALIVLGNTGDEETLKWLRSYGAKNLDEKLTDDWKWAIDRIAQRMIY